MSMIFRLLLSCFLLWPLAVHAQDRYRDDVAGVASAIESNYFDPAQGKRIANDLRASAGKGEFDALADRNSLAEMLTTRLKPLDRHFRVRWSLAEPTQAAGDGPRVRRMVPGQEPGGSGIRQVAMLPGNIGYLSLGEFAHFEPAADRHPAREAIDAALEKLSGSRALIIDLRGNRGGSPQMVGYLVSAFTPPGADIYNMFHTRTGNFSEAPAQMHPNPRLEVPIYVLTNARTGSAAESFTYTMKNAKRATVVGEASGGAANPGGEHDAGNGFVVFVPTGSPVSPITGTNWETVGVIPDVPVAADSALDTALAMARKDSPAFSTH